MISSLCPKIAFQGELGAHSHAACLELFPDTPLLPCATFEDVFSAVSEGRAAHAMIPVENSVAGRVADIHHLMPINTHLKIVGEHFLKIHHHLLSLPGVSLEEITHIASHIHALGQCRKLIARLGVRAVVAIDTAGAARLLAETQERDKGVLASKLAAQLYRLDVLLENVEDEAHNTTRFLILSSDTTKPLPPPSEFTAPLTTFIFRVRNVPSALYKALGGFATNGVNMTKLESYQLEGSFSATEFYADIEGHPETTAVKNALEELAFFSTSVRILGVYNASPFRAKLKND